MFAMRACRKSVMIGKSLTKGQMVNLLRNMGTIDQPWVSIQYDSRAAALADQVELPTWAPYHASSDQAGSASEAGVVDK